MLEVANLIAVAGEDATAHEVRQRYSCPKCKAKGNNTYQIAKELNAMSVPTAIGGKWYGKAVLNAAKIYF